MKAVIFDFDGTLTKSKKGSNCWYKIWEEINDLDYDAFLYNKFLNNQITTDEWYNLIMQRYKQKGVNQQMLETISTRIELLDGVHETLSLLYNNNIKIYVLSGGIKQIIQPVLVREDILKYITSVEAYTINFDKIGKINGYGKPKHNLESKNEYVEIIKNELKIDAKDILFVGNGKNDEDVYKSGAKTLCINPDDADITNKTFWTYGIQNCTNLKQILKFISIKNK